MAQRQAMSRHAGRSQGCSGACPRQLAGIKTAAGLVWDRTLGKEALRVGQASGH
jgi:hypothetical protein